ncbi:MAG: histidine phosphatase family protein [Rhodobacterales bacterium]|nr:histidine phosphatase family protein [Rhodobacterales bacterium]
MKYMFAKHSFNFSLVIFLMVSSADAEIDSKDTLLNALNSVNADILFLRHALAPGFGDPDNFDLKNCDTQRNLDIKGRSQASKIGEELRLRNIKFTEILSSQWCRCKETANLLDLGKWKEFAGLNSFFQNYANKEETMALLNHKFKVLNKGLTLMITHQVVIREVTGKVVSSGGMAAFNSKTGQSVVFQLGN